jgi:exodeoxyribonuclease V alpha subunit
MRSNSDFFASLSEFVNLILDDEVSISELLDRSRQSSFVPQIALSMGLLYFRKYQGFSKIHFFYVVALCHELDGNDICIKLCEESIYKLIDGLCSKRMEQSEYELCRSSLKVFASKIYALTSVQKLISDNDIAGIGTDSAPLVIDHNRLYFRNFYQYEEKVSSYIKGYSQKGSDLTEKDVQFYKSALSILFPDEKDGSLNYQRIAAASSVSSSFSVITGGPGTGKTTTVLNILVLMLLKDRNLRVRLCAPTGKASSRMTESIMNGLSSGVFEDNFKALSQKNLAAAEDFEKIKSLIPKEAITVHKLLGIKPHKERPAFNEDHPLACDVLIVDEVSMISLGLFSKLLAAVGKNTKVILLGDKDQLCSVEPGSVLSDLCSDLDRAGSLSDSRRALICALCSYRESDITSATLTDYVSMLVKSRRFSDSSLLGKFAKAVNAASETPSSNGEISDPLATVKECLEDLGDVEKIFTSVKKLEFFSLDAEAPFKEVKKTADKTAVALIRLYTQDGEFLSELKKASGLVKASEADRYFNLLDKYRILCSNREGQLGSAALNYALTKKLLSYVKTFIKSPDEEFFPGRVILINKNSDMLGVYNGDVGFIAYVEDDRKNVSLKAVFPGKEANKPRVISIEQLSSFEDGMAMTIHKSQGSEYASVIMVLPNRDNMVLCKELVYTGITRAKERVKDGVTTGGAVAIIGNKEVFTEVIKRRVYRESGLSLRLSQS